MDPYAIDLYEEDERKIEREQEELGIPHLVNNI